jgi:hypothetical protein
VTDLFLGFLRAGIEKGDGFDPPPFAPVARIAISALAALALLGCDVRPPNSEVVPSRLGDATVKSSEEAGTATEKVRKQLRIENAVQIDEHIIRSRVLSLVSLGKKRIEVNEIMAAYGLVAATSEKPTSCWPGDRGLLCEFRSVGVAVTESDPKYWIEFVYDDSGRLEDVVATRFQDDIAHPYSTEDIKPGNHSRLTLRNGLGIGSTIGEFQDVYGEGEPIGTAGWPLGLVFDVEGKNLFVAVDVRKLSRDDVRSIRKDPKRLRPYKVELIL